MAGLACALVPGGRGLPALKESDGRIEWWSMPGTTTFSSAFAIMCAGLLVGGWAVIGKYD